MKKKLLCFLSFLFFLHLFCPNNTYAANRKTDSNYYFIGGINLKSMTFIADLRFDSIARFPNDYIRFSYGIETLFGINKFFIIPNTIGGIHLYPLGKIWSIYANGALGAFWMLLANSYHLSYSFGTNFEIPFSKKFGIVLGIEYFYQYSFKMKGYIENEKMYEDIQCISFYIAVRNYGSENYLLK
jgi:hypothetical protein